MYVFFCCHDELVCVIVCFGDGVDLFEAMDINDINDINELNELNEPNEIKKRLKYE